MSKFKVGDKVAVTLESHGFFNLPCEVIMFAEDNSAILIQTDRSVSWMPENLLRLTNTPFNLEQFKSGIPAITYDGREATFVKQENHSILVDIEGAKRWLHEGGTNFKVFKNEPTDLVCMKVNEPANNEAQDTIPVESKDEKRYRWFRTYSTSLLSVPSFDKELEECVTAEAFDKVLDRYSTMFNFNPT